MKYNFAFLKKILIVFLAVVLCLHCFTGCKKLFGKAEPTGAEVGNNDKAPATAIVTVPGNTSDSPTAAPTEIPTEPPIEREKITIHFLDVGQGDSAFIELPGGKTMLIDASVSKASDKIVSFISQKGYDKIDYLVATHPHADHIGGMQAVVEAFDIGEIYMPRATTNTKTYENLLLAIADKGMKIKAASAGKTICEGVEIIAPNSDKYDEMNDYSVVVKITHDNRKFLFMGDAEVLSEKEIMTAGFDVSADVVKVGHHGSGTSSSEAFVKATGAKYAIFSVGEGNSYNHPHHFIVERWEKSGAAVYRTDLSGDIEVVSDGVSLEVKVLGGNYANNN